MHDVRHLAALLRGVNFSNVRQYTFTVLFSLHMQLVAGNGYSDKHRYYYHGRRGAHIAWYVAKSCTYHDAKTRIGTAFIFATLFDEFSFHHARSRETAESSQSAEIDNIAFEIPLNTVIECLNIFGSAGISSSAGGSYKKWKMTEDGSENEGGADENDRDKQRRNGTRPARGIESYFGGGSEKRTGMRLSYAGPGYPLTLIL